MSNFQVTVTTNKRVRIHEGGFLNEAQAVRMGTLLYSNGNAKMSLGECIVSVTATAVPVATARRYR